MTESEAIELIEKDLKLHSKDLSSKYKNGLRMAIQALENQEKIKDLLDSCTAYPDDMCDCLVEIEKILRSDEE